MGTDNPYAYMDAPRFTRSYNFNGRPIRNQVAHTEALLEKARSLAKTHEINWERAREAVREAHEVLYMLLELEPNLVKYRLRPEEEPAMWEEMLERWDVEGMRAAIAHRDARAALARFEQGPGVSA